MLLYEPMTQRSGAAPLPFNEDEHLAFDEALRCFRWGEASTSVDHSPSVTVTGCFGTRPTWHRLQVGPSATRSRGTRFLAWQLGQRSTDSTGEGIPFT